MAGGGDAPAVGEEGGVVFVECVGEGGLIGGGATGEEREKEQGADVHGGEDTEDLAWLIIIKRYSNRASWCQRDVLGMHDDHGGKSGAGDLECGDAHV